MSLVVVEKAESFHEASLIRFAEAGEGLEELRGEGEGPIRPRYRRARRAGCLARRG